MEIVVVVVIPIILKMVENSSQKKREITPKNTYECRVRTQLIWPPPLTSGLMCVGAHCTQVCPMTPIRLDSRSQEQNKQSREQSHGARTSGKRSEKNDYY